MLREYFRLARPFLVLLAIFAVGRWTIGLRGWTTRRGTTSSVSSRSRSSELVFLRRVREAMAGVPDHALGRPRDDAGFCPSS